MLDMKLNRSDITGTKRTRVGTKFTKSTSWRQSNLNENANTPTQFYSFFFKNSAEIIDIFSWCSCRCP